MPSPTMMLAAALVCQGSGFTAHHGAPKIDRSMTGDAWLDAFNNGNDGFVAEARIDEQGGLRLVPPRQLVDFPGYIPLVVRNDDGQHVDAVRFMGPRSIRVTWTRTTNMLTVATDEGAWTGICRRT